MDIKELINTISPFRVHNISPIKSIIKTIGNKRFKCYVTVVSVYLLESSEYSRYEITRDTKEDLILAIGDLLKNEVDLYYDEKGVSLTKLGETEDIISYL